MEQDPISRIRELVSRFQPGIGKTAAMALEEELERLVRPVPDILSIFATHGEDSVREAIVVVAGRLRANISEASGLEELLQQLSRDKNKWVRIKAERALQGGNSDAARMSPAGKCCMRIFQAVGQNAPGREIWELANELESAFRRKVMRRRGSPRGVVGSDSDATLLFFAMAFGGASTKAWDHDIDDSPGWKGDELRLLTLRRISPIIATFAVWPGRSTRIFLSSFYDHDDWPDDFALWSKELDTPAAAKAEIERLEVGMDGRYPGDGSWQGVFVKV